MKTVLMVCTGNICRSPMAAALLRARLRADAERSDWRVLSAGTRALEGWRASPDAVAEMEDRGIALRDHRSQSVTKELMEAADLVLVMTRHHAHALSAAFPDQATKVHLLSEMVGRTYDIADPYGGTPQEYASTAQELEDLIEKGYERILWTVLRSEAR